MGLLGDAAHLLGGAVKGIAKKVKDKKIAKHLGQPSAISTASFHKISLRKLFAKKGGNPDLGTQQQVNAAITGQPIPQDTTIAAATAAANSTDGGGGSGSDGEGMVMKILKYVMYLAIIGVVLWIAWKLLMWFFGLFKKRAPKKRKATPAKHAQLAQARANIGKKK